MADCSTLLQSYNLAVAVIGIPDIALTIDNDVAHPASSQGHMGFQSTPVTLIDGETVVGFDQKRIEQLLGP